MNEIRINRRAAERLRSGHPWVYASDVVDRGSAQPGDVVKVMEPSGRSLGTAHFSSTSQICLRLLSSKVEPFDSAFLRKRIQAAADFRKSVVRDTDAYRLIFSEADLLPALIVDRYGEYLVVQTLDQGMDRALAIIVSVLLELFSPKAIVERNDAAVRQREELPLRSGVVFGEIPDSVRVKMNGLTLDGDLVRGQKTGIYLDQRENYVAAARYAHGKALDCFTSTGGFALHMAPRCNSVEAVDSSQLALEIASLNRTTNQISNVDLRQADVFELLTGYAAARRSFDTVVLDPPAFAKTRKNMEGAVRGYKDLNLRALRLLGPGGILVTCSCSHHMSEAELLQVVAQASLDAGRQLRVLERRTQSADHPILLTVPESLYLKCLILQVVP